MLSGCPSHTGLHSVFAVSLTTLLAPTSLACAGVYDDLFQRLAKQEEKAHEERADRKGKRAPGPFPRFGALRWAWHGVGPQGGWRYAVGAEAWGVQTSRRLAPLGGLILL